MSSWCSLIEVKQARSNASVYIHSQLQHLHSFTITTPKRHSVNITGHFSCITEHVAYYLSCTKRPSTAYIRETGPRLAARFREHRRDVISVRNELPVSAHLIQSNKSYTGGNEGSGVEGGPSQPGLPNEAGDEANVSVNSRTAHAPPPRGKPPGH